MISFTLACWCLSQVISSTDVWWSAFSVRTTAPHLHPNGVDYVVLPGWKIFMIQFLNIAGLGPIFGAIMGAKFGESCFLWIVLGSIFAGATHDYLAAMLSLRHDGESLPELTGRYLGSAAR